MKKHFLIITAIAALFTISSCKKDKEELTGKGPVTIFLDNRAGTDVFALGTNYKTAAGDTVNFTKFKYYVSNFVLVKADGSEYVIPQTSTYKLVDAAVPASQEFTFNDIPAGKYTRIKYVIGVDSLRSTTDVSQRTGDLDPAGTGADMYWSWNSGYIFYKIEGTSPQSTEAGNIFMLHIGGYGGYSSPGPNNIRNVSIVSTEALEVGEGRSPEAHIFADVLQAFTSPTNYSLATGAVIHMPIAGATIANNYADMFTLDHVHNDH
jgi:hypothetical protein